MENISELLSSIPPEQLEQLKAVAANLLTNASKDTASSGTSDPAKAVSAAAPMDSAASDPIFGALAKLSQHMEEDSDTTRFLKSLKPLLSEEKQKRADEAIRFLHLMDTLPLLKGIL